MRQSWCWDKSKCRFFWKLYFKILYFNYWIGSWLLHQLPFTLSFILHRLTLLIFIVYFYYFSSLKSIFELFIHIFVYVSYDFFHLDCVELRLRQILGKFIYYSWHICVVMKPPVFVSKSLSSEVFYFISPSLERRKVFLIASEVVTVDKEFEMRLLNFFKCCYKILILFEFLA